MEKAAIKNFATTARTKLIENVKQKAYGLGITEKEIVEPKMYQGGFRIGERIFKEYQKKHYNKLVVKIREKGYKQVVEEVAYTWFNRLIAIRFMEVNEYLPVGVRVLSSAQEGKVEPDVVTQVTIYVEDLELDINLVYELQDANNTEELFKYILVKQCNKLNEILPDMFEQIEDYTELLLPDKLLQEGSVLRDLVTMVPEDDWKEQVEIIGWLYQEYISDRKAEIDKLVETGMKVTKNMLPAKTQLFTPKWIVKYMVENSLGRLWLESHPNEDLKQQWKYYLEEAEQEPRVQEQLDKIKNKELSPEEIKVLDPCMGSGHLLVYAFDVLYQIYKEAGYSERDIPKYIIEKNLYGLDIDDRAAQLAYFAVMMKARSYDRRIFRKKLHTNLASIQESNGIAKEAIEYLINEGGLEIEKANLRADVEYLIHMFNNAKEYGSILEVEPVNYEAIEKRVEEISNDENVRDLFFLEYKDLVLERIPLLLKQAKIMSCKHDIVITNPPYLGYKHMNENLIEFVRSNYPNSKNDLFTVYIESCLMYLKQNGFCSLLNPHSWMFNSKYEKLRGSILTNSIIINMSHFGRGVFGSDHGTTSLVMRKHEFIPYLGVYKKLFYKQGQVDSLETKESYFFNNDNVYYYNQANYSSIPNQIISYWASERQTELLSYGNKLGDYASPNQGMATADNKRFVRKWFEVRFDNIGFECGNREIALNSKKRWFPYNNGGDFRKWYGNNIDIVNWENDGEEIKTHIVNRYKYLKGNYSFVIKNEGNYFREGLTWTAISSSKFGVRYFEQGYLFSNAGMAIFEGEISILLLSAILNSQLAKQFLDILSPTMNYNQGDVKQVPILFSQESKDKLIEYAKRCIEISKIDWDSNETSWGFTRSPLLENKQTCNSLEKAYNNWAKTSLNMNEEIKSIEHEINSILVNEYKLNSHEAGSDNELEITLKKLEVEYEIKAFISYYVGCLFGRYSLGKKGLVRAGGDFDINEYSDFQVNLDNIIPVTADEYFEDDIVNGFIKFVKSTFSEETLEDNLDFISKTLGRKNNETSRQSIRRYFLKDFYKDHVQTYQKRPIYWLFDSGKQDGFKALIYMHRYDESTIAQVRTDYLHTLQRKYEAEMNRQDMIIEGDGSSREKTEAKKKKEKLQKQLLECIEYDQVIAHVANQRIGIDLDDGVKVNYMKFQNIEVPQGEGKKPLKANLLANIKL